MSWDWIEENIVQQTQALTSGSLKPPCARCRNWNPRLTIITSAKGQKLESVQMCVAAEQHHDFSCFEKHTAQTNLDRELEKFKNNKDTIQDIAQKLGRIGSGPFKDIAPGSTGIERQKLRNNQDAIVKMAGLIGEFGLSSVRQAVQSFPALGDILQTPEASDE